MVRLRGTDGLKDLEGTLSGAFDAATLVMLSADFVARQPEEDREAARNALTAFRVAASGVRSSERAFNDRAKPVGRPDHMKHLRGADEMAALREMRLARESLLDLDPDRGDRISRSMMARFSTQRL